MNAFEVTSTLTVDDWLAYQRAWASRLQARSRVSRGAVLSAIAIALILASVLAMLAHHLGGMVPFAAIVIGACAAVIGISTNLRRLRGASQPDARGVVLGYSRMRFDNEGMHLDKTHSTILHGWPVFQEVTRTTTHLFVWVDRVAALIVPLRDLPEGMTAEDAILRIHALAADARPADTPIETVGSIASPASVASGQIAIAEPARRGRFFPAIGRLLLLRPAPPQSLALDDRSMFWLAAGCVAWWMLLDRIAAPQDSEFYAYGVALLGWYVAILLLVALLWSRLSQPRVEFRGTLALVLGFVPVGIALSVAAGHYLSEPVALGAFVLIALYATFYGNAGLRSLTFEQQPRALFAGLAVLALAAWFGQAQYLTPQLWYPPDDAGEDQSSAALPATANWPQLEPLLFEQAARIDAAVDAIERPDVPAAAFFVGFAGVGEQRVFAREIALAASVVGAKYGSESQSIELINDQRDLTSHPLASATALRRTLSKLSEKMHRDQDVLFLSLSSHGSEDGEISVSNGSIPVNDLSAAELADALRASGIRWRVIIVSACYSGLFIDPLKDDHTIIITASAADRTSFGCSDDRDLTYFGEAFYRDSLPGTPDLKAAFQRMKGIIARRERDEGIEPSYPQAYFGSAIDRHLRVLGSRLTP